VLQAFDRFLRDIEHLQLHVVHETARRPDESAIKEKKGFTAALPTKSTSMREEWEFFHLVFA
jgi:hypothetical protein